MSANAQAMLERAVQLHQSGNTAAARVQYQKLLAKVPRHFVALNLLGATYIQTGEPEKGIPFIERSLAIEPRYAEAHNNLGAAFKAQACYDQAAACYLRALAFNPRFAEAHNNFGVVLQELKRPQEALQSYERALALNPNYVDAISNLGTIFKTFHRYEEALAAYEKALALNPKFIDGYHNLGATLEDMNRHDDALRVYEQALALQPGYAEAAWSRGLLLLSQGKFAEGWPVYEKRWNRQKTRPLAPTPYPLWLGGEEIAGKNLLIQFEQGLGDLIQICRYLPLLEARGAACTLQAPFFLRGLMQRNFPTVRVVLPDDPGQEIDYRVPMMSLPLALGTETEAAIPQTVPYLRADPEKVESWRVRLGSGSVRRVGLVWRGNPEHVNDANRSARLADFVPLLSRPDIQFVILQKNLTEDETALLRNYPEAAVLDTALTDFEETAAVVALLDEVISVDSAPVHLAGALGRPTSLLLPFHADWRWMIGRADTPWYPTVRLLRQPVVTDWGSLIQSLCSAF